MEKKVGIVKGICLFMALLCTVIVGWFVYRAGEGRYKTYKVTAAEMLKEALVQEMDTRPAIESYIGRIGETRPWESLPDTIVPRWKSAEGTFPFGFPSSELRNNIAGEEKGIDGGICALHSIKLLENPMNADSLYQRWLHLLPFSQHPTLGLRMNYTDLYGKGAETP